MKKFFENAPVTRKLKMSELIQRDYRYLLTIDRFNIPLGFKDKTIEEVCALNDVDLNTFLLVANMLENPASGEGFPVQEIKIPLIIQVLKKTHSHFLDYRLPKLREDLGKMIINADEVHKTLLLDFFDQYEKEVRRHMRYEEKYVYPYVVSLFSNGQIDGHDIEYYERQHNDIERKINDLRNIIIKYLPPLGDVNQVNDLLYMLFQSEEDLNRHTFIEENILFPAVKWMESKRKNNG
ncbi:MAG: hemerythrin domain-containing protein [Bacteroidales bacterium]